MKMIRVSDQAHRALKMEAAARQGTITTLVDELLGRLGKMVEGDGVTPSKEAAETPARPAAAPPRGASGPSPLDCPHPRNKVVPASVGGVLVCGLCGEEVSYD